MDVKLIQIIIKLFNLIYQGQLNDLGNIFANEDDITLLESKRAEVERL